MALYFFDLSDGNRDRDAVGTDFPDDRSARRMAVRFAGEVLQYEPERLEHGALRVEVSDMSRTVLFALDVRLARGADA